MHPILARGSRLALYLGVWVLVAALLAQLMAGRVGLSWRQAVLVALPAALVYAFVCLSAWYVARSLPLKTTGTWRILLTGLVASHLLSSEVDRQERDLESVARSAVSHVGPEPGGGSSSSTQRRQGVTPGRTARARP